MDIQELSKHNWLTAREYLVAWKTDLVRLQKEIAAQKSALELWQGRQQLAQEKNKPELAEQARLRCVQEENKLQQLQSEEQKLQAELVMIKDQLKRLPPDSSVNTDQLLAELEVQELTGAVTDKTEQEFTKLAQADSIEAELTRLKNLKK